MKKLLRFFVVGIIVLAFLAGTAIGRTTTTIEVVYNTVNITVNGQNIEADNILYNGVTYVPLRAVAEALNKEVGWDQDTMTASINDKPETATVTRVVDGDTLVVNYKGSEERVRLIGVDTPESVHPDVAKNLPEGKVASEYTKSKLEGKDIELEFDVQERDQYGRILAYVWVDGEMFNKTLLKEGYARVATYPPNVKYVNDFIKIQEEARKNNKGFWSNDTFNGEVVKDNISNSVTPVKKEGNYVGSIDSDKYHNSTCRYAEIIKEDKQIWFDTVEEAEKAGYSACGVCKP